MRKITAVLMLMFVYTANASWKEEVVVDNLDFSISYNATVTVQNSPHIFYRGQYLYHSYLVNGVWKQEKIDRGLIYSFWGGDTPQEVSATVDQQNQMHIMYRSVEDKLKYAVGTNGDWTIHQTPLIPYMSASSMGDIAVDSSGNVHIVYPAYDISKTDGFKYFYEHAIYDGNQWTRNPIDYVPTASCSSDKTGCNISLEVDDNDNLHLVYATNEFPEKNLKYQFYSNGTWIKSTIVSKTHPNPGWDDSNEINIVLQNNKPMVCYSSYDDDPTLLVSKPQLVCANEINGQWQSSIINISDNSGLICRADTMIQKSGNSLIQGARRCFNANFDQFYIQRIELNNGVWVAQESIEYHPQNNILYVLEFTGTNLYVFGPELMYDIETNESTPTLAAFKLGQTPTTEKISNLLPTISGGYNPNLVFDSNDSMHLTHSRFWYSTKSTNGWTNYSVNPDYLNTLDPSDIKSELQFSISSDGTKHFFFSNLYAHFSNKYLKLDDTGTTTVTTNFLPQVFITDASSPAVIIDDQDFLHITFLDTQTWEIYYATNISGEWKSESIYRIEYTDIEKENYLRQIQYDDASYYLTLKVDSNNKVRIAFIEWHSDSASNLTTLTNTDGNWIKKVVAQNSIIDTWKSPTVVIDTDLNIHMTYLTSHKEGLFYYPAGLVYGSNTSGIWLDQKISSESFYYNEPKIRVYDAWVTSLEADIAINDNKEVLISYIFGTTVYIPDFASELRVTRINNCMPVSRAIYSDIDALNNTTNGIIDGAINKQGLAAVAFYDNKQGEPHVFIEQRDLDVKSCALDDNNFRVEVKNISNTDILLKNISHLTYVDNMYTISDNTCSDANLTTDASCYIDVNVSLPIQIDYLFNVESTFYLDLNIEKNNSQPTAISEDISFIIETESLRPKPALTTTPTTNNTANSSGGGSLGFFSILLLLIHTLLTRKMSKGSGLTFHTKL